MEAREERRRRKQQASASARLSAAAIAVVGVMMIFGIVYKSQKSKSSCFTDHSSGKVSCRNKPLKSIPDDISESASSLHFGDKNDKHENHFVTIEAANFSKFTQLKELNLVKCGIETIQPETFQDLSQVQRLDLSYNKIQVLSSESFQGLRKLDYLNLSFNPTQSIPDGAFSAIAIGSVVFGSNPALGELPPGMFTGAQIEAVTFNKCNFNQLPESLFQPLASSLKDVTVTNNIRPLTIPKKTFQNLKLRVLDLSNNGMTSTDFGDYLSVEYITLNNNPLNELSFNGSPLLQSVKHLHLENTRLKFIHKKNLERLVNLETLDVSDNLLMALNIGEISHLSKLHTVDVSNNALCEFEGGFDMVPDSVKVLYLHQNTINHLPGEMGGLFSRLERLTLHDNPLHCNCELKWLSEWLEVAEHRAILQQYDSVMCQTPDVENFTQVSDYGFQCRKPSILNATSDVDRVALICTAEGDPAPTVKWISPKGEEKSTEPHPFLRDQFQTIHTMAVTRAGNYTCVAANRVGQDSVVVNTETMPTMGLKFHVKSQEIEILETPAGFCITCVLIGLLGLIFRNS